jgi:hypothetical protein
MMVVVVKKGQEGDQEYYEDETCYAQGQVKRKWKRSVRNKLHGTPTTLVTFQYPVHLAHPVPSLLVHYYPTLSK